MRPGPELEELGHCQSQLSREGAETVFRPESAATLQSPSGVSHWPNNLEGRGTSDTLWSQREIEDKPRMRDRIEMPTQWGCMKPILFLFRQWGAN